MKLCTVRLFSFLALFYPFTCLGQLDSLIDQRDQKVYPVAEIKGTIWMLDNLDYVTEQSLGLSKDQKAFFPRIQGRWYHMHELENVCPAGWQLPHAQDWVDYFEYLSEQIDTSIKIKSYKENVSIHKFEDKIDLFEKNNALNIETTGIFQGLNYIQPNVEEQGKQADYWIVDLPSKKTKDESQERELSFKPVRLLHKGRSHIHLYNKFTNIHSHEHHLDPSDQKTLRRFMVRCVRIKNEDYRKE